jgi:hypothetical protein
VTTPRLVRYLVGTFAVCCLSSVAFVGCGSTSNSSSSSNTTSAATATACAQLRSRTRPVTGTIQSVSGQTIHITQNTGGSVGATYSSITNITQEQLVSTSMLQQGANVLIQVQQNSNGTYTATSITLTQGNPFGQRPKGTGQGQRPGNNGFAACFGGQRRGQGFGNGGGQTNSMGPRTLSGTVGVITGTTLTVIDRQQNTYSLVLASDTKVIQTTSATSSAIQPNMGIRVTGQNNNGVITASSLTIYAPGLLPTPTPSTT